MMTLPEPTSPVMATASATLSDLAEILFCSDLQPSQHASRAQVRAAVMAALRRHGDDVGRFACVLAERYGENPDTACARMRWCRQMVADAFTPAAHAA
jgi:hypothetical protein